MTQHSGQTPLRDRPQPGDLNPQAEGDMLGQPSDQRDLGIDPDAILAEMVAHTLGKDRLQAKEYVGVVMRTDIGIKGLTPEMGPYYKAYKEIEKLELEKDEATGTQNTVAKAQDALFMMKVRIPVLDSMIPDPPLYDIDQSLSEAVTTRLDSLTPEESLSIKLISMHTTFVGQRGGWFSSPPPVGSYVRVTYDNVKNLSGPVYVGTLELDDSAASKKSRHQKAPDLLSGGGCGALGGLYTAGKKKLTKAKDVSKSYFSGKGVPESRKDRITREIKEYEETRDEIATREGIMSEEDALTVKACSQQIRKLKAELKNLTATPSSGDGDTSDGERRQDPTVPASAPAGGCNSSGRVGQFSGNTDFDSSEGWPTLDPPGSLYNKTSKEAKMLLAAVGTPYVWGGKGWNSTSDENSIGEPPARNYKVGGTTPVRSNQPTARRHTGGVLVKGYDCSGFATAALIVLGVLPKYVRWISASPSGRRDHAVNHMFYNDFEMIWTKADGKDSPKLKNVQTGDCLFWHGSNQRKMRHIGVVLGPLTPSGASEYKGKTAGRLEYVHAAGKGDGEWGHRGPPKGDKMVRAQLDALNDWQAHQLSGIGRVRTNLVINPKAGG